LHDSGHHENGPSFHAWNIGLLRPIINIMFALANLENFIPNATVGMGRRLVSSKVAVGRETGETSCPTIAQPLHHRDAPRTYHFEW
jgi:hypothetical protein